MPFLGRCLAKSLTPTRYLDPRAKRIGKGGVGQAERTSVGWGGNALAPVARW